jgi:outer membrane lipoprotein-sorting protein
MKSISFLICLLIIINCSLLQKKLPEETVEFSDPIDSKGFYKPEDKRSNTLLEFVKDLEGKSSSFTSEFSLKIVTGNETSSINGKIFYEKDGKKVKIQLLDPFFGAILSQILANPNTIKIRQGGNDKLHVQKMGDIVIQDPSTGKIFRIPFPIIFYSIALDFTAEFTSKDSLLNPTEKKVKVTRNSDEYLYIFYDSGLESLEYVSKDKNLQAKAKVSESSKKGTHPPERILTRVSEITTGKNISQVDIVYKNIKRTNKISDKEFQL